MAELVTIEQARHQVGATPYHDDQLTLYIGAAVEHAQEFLNRRVYPDADTLAAAVLDGSAGDDPMVVNDAVRAAILLLVGHLFRNREAVVAESVTELPMGVHTLLWPYRVGLGV